MSDSRLTRPAPSPDAAPSGRAERSRLGRAFGSSLLIALALVLAVLLTVGRLVPIGPIGALVVLALAWFAAFAAMLRWRAPSSRNAEPRP